LEAYFLWHLCVRRLSSRKSNIVHKPSNSYISYSDGIDFPPLVFVMIGIVQDCKLLGLEHTLTYNGGTYHRKQLILSPIDDDFNCQVALFGSVFSSPTMIYLVWDDGLTFGTELAKGVHLCLRFC
jgi:hypothetical protein